MSELERPASGQSLLRRLGHGVVVVVGALGFAVALFLVLPLIEAIAKPPDSDLIVQSIDTANIPPPPPPPEEPEKEEEKEEEEEPPKLNEEAPPIDLSQLELALNQGIGGGDWLAGDFGVKLNAVASSTADVEALFSSSELDQMPRVIHQPGPTLDRRLREKAPGTVYVIFIVEQDGRVYEPKVQQSTDPIFESAALTAVKQWKFEPGKRNGEPVRFRMRVPITFPKSR